MSFGSSVTILAQLINLSSPQHQSCDTCLSLHNHTGLTTAFSIVVALMFYQERLYVSSTKIVVLVLSVILILCGIAIMTISDTVHTGPTQAHHHIRMYHGVHHRMPPKEQWEHTVAKVVVLNVVKDLYAHVRSENGAVEVEAGKTKSRTHLKSLAMSALDKDKDKHHKADDAAGAASGMDVSRALAVSTSDVAAL